MILIDGKFQLVGSAILWIGFLQMVSLARTCLCVKLLEIELVYLVSHVFLCETCWFTWFFSTF